MAVIVARTKSADDTQALAASVAPVLTAGDIVVLAGGLGTGKTTFAQGLARGLGVPEQVTSPTFILLRTYEGGRLPFVHVDVYRLDRLQEAIDLGLAEVLDDGVAAIEWGDAVAPVLPADYLEVRLERGAGDDDRLVRVRPVGTRWSARLGGLRQALERWVEG
jgi:tRNA threonylcarbamoyladenosine biosynthesis protein TsaE